MSNVSIWIYSGGRGTWSSWNILRRGKSHKCLATSVIDGVVEQMIHTVEWHDELIERVKCIQSTNELYIFKNHAENKCSVVRLEIGRVEYWLWWGETDVSELRLHGPIVHPRVTVMWTMVWWCRLGLTPNLSTRALWLSDSPVSRDISERT
jgi:hypothetical protein